MPAPNPVPVNGSGMPGSRRSRRSPISTSPLNPPSTAPRSPAWKPAAGWPRPATSSYWGRPASGKTHEATALAIAAAHAGHRVAFAPATGWITRLAEAHRIDRLDAELRPACICNTRRGSVVNIQQR